MFSTDVMPGALLLASYPCMRQKLNLHKDVHYKITLLAHLLASVALCIRVHQIYLMRLTFFVIFNCATNF